MSCIMLVVYVITEDKYGVDVFRALTKKELKKLTKFVSIFFNTTVKYYRVKESSNYVLGVAGMSALKYDRQQPRFFKELYNQNISRDHVEMIAYVK